MQRKKPKVGKLRNMNERQVLFVTSVINESPKGNVIDPLGIAALHCIG